jgi:hypothetical protein
MKYVRFVIAGTAIILKPTISIDLRSLFSSESDFLDYSGLFIGNESRIL